MTDVSVPTDMSTIYAPTVSTTTVTPPATARDVAVLAAVTTTVLAWASAFVVIRWAGESFSPGALALGRLALGSAALGALLLARRRWVAPNRREWVLLGVCGVAWFAVYNVALNAAEQHLDAGTTAMLVNIGPILMLCWPASCWARTFLAGCWSVPPSRSPEQC